MLLPPPSLLSSLRSNLAPTPDPTSIHGSVVQTFHTGKQNGHKFKHLRPRAELAVALPGGGGVNVYDVRASKLAARYAIPPGETFPCAPASLVVISQDQQSAQLDDEEPRRKRRRLTFAASTDLNKKPRRTRISCWEELLGKNVSPTARLRTRSAIVSKKGSKEGKVVFLATTRDSVFVEDIEEELKFRPSVIAVLDNGEVSSWNEDLEESTSRSGNINTSSTEQQVEKAILIEAEEAKNGVLKGRDDIKATIEARGEKELLVVATRERHPAYKMRQSRFVVKVLTFRFRRDLGSISSDGHNGVSTLATICLPEPEYFSTRKSELWFDSCAGRLYQQVEKSLAVYDLTGSTARLEWLVKLDKKVRSLFPMSSTAVITASSTVLSIVDTKYSSTLASGALESTAKNTDRAIGEQALVSSGVVKLLSYFPLLGTVVALLGRNLVVFQVDGKNLDNMLSKEITHSMLVEAVKHGARLQPSYQTASLNLLNASQLGYASAPEAFGKHWRANVSPVNGLIGAGNDAIVDSIACKELDIEEPVSRDGEPLHRTRTKIQFLLSKLFSLKRSSSSLPAARNGLQIRVFPPRTIHWLANNGFFTLEQIEVAMKEYHAFPITESLSPCALVEALYAYDNSLNVLLSICASPIVLSPAEIACAIKLAINASQQPESKLDNRLLLLDIESLRTASSKNPTASVSQVHTQIAHKLSSESADDIAQEAHAVLRQCLFRIQSTPLSALRPALALVLPSTTDLLNLVNYLRLALVHTGWLSGYVNDASPFVIEAVASAHNKDNSFEAAELPSGLIAAAAVLLNAAFDILGDRASLEYAGKPETPPIANKNLGNASEVGENTLSHTRAEICAIVEGIEETAFFANMIEEFLVYSNPGPMWSLPRPSKDCHRISKRKNRSKRKVGERSKAIASTRAMTKPITIVGHYFDSSGRLHGGTLGAGNAEANSLSFGLNVDSDLMVRSFSKTRGRESLIATRQMVKVSGGGQVSQRSRRDIGQMKSKQVGPHTFERVIV